MINAGIDTYMLILSIKIDGPWDGAVNELLRYFRISELPFI